MKLSPFFHELKSAFDAELDDMCSDSAGNDVLASRLEAKRAQLPTLMSMVKNYPEMGAVAFHNGIHFTSGKAMDALVAREPDEFPSWTTLLPALELSDWAGKLAKTVLAHPDGEQFLIVAAGLEYLHGKSDTGIPFDAASDQEDGDAEEKGHQFSDEYEEEDADADLAEAGSDWMVEQGFDRNN